MTDLQLDQLTEDLIEVIESAPNVFTSAGKKDLFAKVKYTLNQLVNEIGGGGSVIYDGATPTNLTVGGIPAGTDLTAMTLSQIIQALLITYINPTFTASSITGQATTVEVGTTLSGSKTFTWTINSGTGIVLTVDIYDNTAASTLLAGTPNDGSQAVTVTTRQLNTPAATQSWKIIGNNSDNSTTFSSNNFIVTARYSNFFGAVSTTPTNSAQVRALPQTGFYSGAGTIQLNTGSSLIKFGVALPPGTTLVSAIDLDASNASVTYSLIGTIAVLDAGGTSRTYNYYEANIAVPYSTSHRHQITIS